MILQQHHNFPPLSLLRSDLFSKRKSRNHPHLFSWRRKRKEIVFLTSPVFADKDWKPWCISRVQPPAPARLCVGPCTLKQSDNDAFKPISPDTGCRAIKVPWHWVSLSFLSLVSHNEGHAGDICIQSRTSEARVTMFDVASRQCHGPHGGPATRDVDGGDKNVFSCEIYPERK